MNANDDLLHVFTMPHFNQWRADDLRVRRIDMLVRRHRVSPLFRRRQSVLIVPFIAPPREHFVELEIWRRPFNSIL